MRVLLLLLITLISCQKEDPTIRNTSNGLIKGVIENNLYVWKGVPYAKPPVNELRWRPPVALDDWDDIRMADTYGNICPQTGYGPESIYEIPPQEMSEDCLYLNIWSPDTEASLPVFVWIHGGSLTREGGTHPQYLGAGLAPKGVVYVSINYRLNAFGFLAHPELSKESELGISGNYGLMDQIAALEWIQENISSFGGDPSNVTIGGESAGGWSVTLLTATEKAKGLFHKAIAQSGAYLWGGPHLKEARNGYQSGEDEGTIFMEKLGARSIQDLRQVSAEKIRDLFFSESNNLSSEPLVDGFLFNEDIKETYEKGLQNNVDIITGSNSHEWSLWIPENLPTNVDVYRSQIEKIYPGKSELFFQAYPVTDSASIANAYMHSMGDQYFHLHDRNWARKMHQAGNRTYMYYFSRTPSERYPATYGAFHGAEIVYALNNLKNDPGSIGTGVISTQDQAYANQVSDYWVNFIKTGNPNGPDLPKWPEWNTEDEPFLEFAQDEIKQGNFLLKDRLDAAERFFSIDQSN